MKKETKEFILVALIYLLIVGGLAIGIIALKKYADKGNLEWREAQKEDFAECLNKTDDIEWCYDEFVY